MITLELKKQLRYLLHGCPEHFDNVDIELYSTSQESSLWYKVARSVLDVKKELWRLIDNTLVSELLYYQKKDLGISNFEPKQVINLIQELGAESVNQEFLKLEDIEIVDLLNKIAEEDNIQLWKQMRLHKDINGIFVSITENTYWYNPDININIPENLINATTLIELSNNPSQRRLQKEEIEEWNAKTAIDFILKTDIPSQYYSIILECLSQLNDQEKTELIQTLKTEQWLINAQNQSAINPNNLLYISDNQLQNHTDKIVSLNQSLNQDKYSDSVLPEFIREHSEYKWLTSNLFDNWDAKKIVKFVLKQPNPDHYWEIILDILQSLNYNFDSDIENLIKDRQWIAVNNGTPKKPNQIIDLAPIKPLEPLKKYLPTLVELSEDAYALFSMLPPEMQEHGAFNWLKGNKYFSIWYQNNIIDFILHLQQPHQDCQILLATVDNLLKNNYNHNQPISSNNSQRLKQKAWLITSAGKPVIPQQVIYYPDLSQEIDHILSITQNSEYTDYSKLDDSIKESELVVNWLSENCFISEEDAFKKIGELVANIPEYQLGQFDDFLLQECLGTKNELGVFQGIPSDILPCWSLVEKLVNDNQHNLKKYILPALLNEIKEDRLINLLNWLSNKHPKPNSSVISVYNQYLTIACKYSNFSSKILLNIKFLNRCRDWKSSNYLGDGTKNNNIDDEDILNDQQLEIIKDNIDIYFEVTQGKNQIVNTSHSQLQIENYNYIFLQKYAKELKENVEGLKDEVIGFLLLILAGDNLEVQKLANSYLGKRHLSINEILNLQKIHNIQFLFKVKQLENNQEDILSITGQYFKANQKSQISDNLFYGKPEYKNQQITISLASPYKIKHISVDQVSKIIQNSIKKIMSLIYNSSETQNLFQLLGQIFKNLSDSAQIDINATKKYILKGLHYLARNLKINNQDFVHNLIQLEEQEYTLEDIHKEDNKKIKAKINNIRQTLENQITKDQQIILDVLTAVKNKIKEHGYNPQSIIFELFQNADDALVEWSRLLQREVDDSSKVFVLTNNVDEINIMHWGRPINCYWYKDFPEIDYRSDGYDRDLLKMLVINSTDKNNLDQDEEITGKFGLGFKAVHLVCDEPYILSGDLGFKVVAGLLPNNLPIEYKENLRQTLEQQNTNLNNGTIIHLRLNSHYQGKSEQITNSFYYLVGILLVFAKRIKQCRLINSEHGLHPKELYWQPNKVLDIDGIEFGNLEIQDKKNNNRWLTKQSLYLKIQEKASLLLCFDEVSGKIQSSLPKDIPTLWVTAPTTEKLELGFLLNAKFDITTGRQKFIESYKNYQLAKEIGELLGKQLCLLFNRSQGNWTQLKTSLHLQDVSEYDFWLFIWQELAEKWLHKDSNYALHIIRLVLGGNCGMGYFITHCPSLPNGLWGNYQKLISPEKTRYIITGILADQDCFNKVSTWTEFKRCLDNIVNESVWKNVKLLLGDYFNFQQTQELKLIDVLKWELGEQVRAIPTVAEKLGQLITRKFLSEFYPESLDIGEVLKTIKFQAEDGKFYASYKLLSKYYLRHNLSSTDYYEILGIPYNSEIHDIKKAYRSLARKYHPDVNKEANADEQFKKINLAYETLSDTEKRLSYDQKHQLLFKMEKTEEQLLADFAPHRRLINYDYVDIALDFFFICRYELEDISIQELAQWVWEANTESQRQAVINYLEKGKKAHELTSYLQKTNRNSWLKEDSIVSKILDDIAVVEEYKESAFKEYREAKNYNNDFSQSPASTTNIPNSDSSINTPVTSKPTITLKHIYEWWKNIDRDQYIKQYYEDSIYPIKTSDLRKKLKLEDRDYWMILFFLGLTHRIGRTKYEQHRDFIKFCRENKNWWRSFSSSQPKQKSEQWMKVLNEYFDNDKLVEEIKWLYWMEKFPVIYQISCYLDEYIQIFTDIDKINQVFNLKHITAVRGSYIFSGTGIDAPPLLLGMGANFIVRELVRLKVIELTPYIIEHCFVPKGNVRSFLTMLGCPNLREWTPDTSKKIYRFLCEQFRELGISEEEVTFNNAFDIPFQLLADNPKLRQEVFKQNIALDDFGIDENEFYYDDED